MNNDENEIKNLNQVGARIKWCREQLGLFKKQVAKEIGLYGGTYSDRENGMRAICHEEYLVVARYFDSLWKKKFHPNYPEYQGQKIERVLVIWIMYGILEE